MTFIVNQDGVVFQKDLGEDTATVVKTASSKFDPDSHLDRGGAAGPRQRDVGS